MLVIQAVCLAVLLSACVPASLGDDPVVSTTSGKVRGVRHPLLPVYEFRGIPFAKQSRFKEPEPYPAWSGVRNATTFGPSCPQVGKT